MYHIYCGVSRAAHSGAKCSVQVPWCTPPPHFTLSETGDLHKLALVALQPTPELAIGVSSRGPNTLVLHQYDTMMSRWARTHSQHSARDDLLETGPVRFCVVSELAVLVVTRAP